MGQLTTIAIKKETREKLKKFGTKDETYDEIIRKMVKEIDYETFMEVQYRRASEAGRFVPLRKA